MIPPNASLPQYYPESKGKEADLLCLAHRNQLTRYALLLGEALWSFIIETAFKMSRLLSPVTSKLKATSVPAGNPSQLAISLLLVVLCGV